MGTWAEESTYSTASGTNGQYVVLQVTLKEKFLGTGSGNLTQLEEVINNQAAKGYRLHTIATSTSHSTGFAGGDRIQATMVFERLPYAGGNQQAQAPAAPVASSTPVAFCTSCGARITGNGAFCTECGAKL